MVVVKADVLCVYVALCTNRLIGFEPSSLQREQYRDTHDIGRRWEKTTFIDWSTSYN